MKIIKKEIFYECDWFNIIFNRVQLSSGKIIERYHQINYKKESVGVLITNADKHILLAKAYRFFIQKNSWELPAGYIEPGETASKAAKREAYEETGLKIKKVKKLFSYYPSNGLSDQFLHLYHAEIGNEPVSLKPDLDELKSLCWFTRDEVLKMIEKKQISDGPTILAILASNY